MIFLQETLDEALGNDGGEGTDHCHTPLKGPRGIIDSSLTLLASTPDPIPDYTSNISSRELCHRIRTKLPPEFQRTSSLTTAYLAGYDAGLPDPLSHSEAMSGCSSAQWKLGCDDEFQPLDQSNTWKLVPRPRKQAVLGGKLVFKSKRDASGQIVFMLGRNTSILKFTGFERLLKPDRFFLSGFLEQRKWPTELL